jgi:hypothetical protein
MLNAVEEKMEESAKRKTLFLAANYGNLNLGRYGIGTIWILDFGSRLRMSKLPKGVNKINDGVLVTGNGRSKNQNLKNLTTSSR